MYKKTIIMLIFFMPYHLFAMEPAAKDEECLVLPALELQVFDLVANYLIHPKTVRSVAEINKKYKQKMCVMAEKRAVLLRHLYLKDCAQNIQEYHATTVPLGAFTGNYGTARCDVFYRPDSDLLIMKQCELEDDDNILYQKEKKFPGFIRPLSHHPKPFFTKEGLLCFHGYGKIGMSRSGFNLVRYLVIGLPMGVIRYDFNGDALQCFLSYKNGKKRECCGLACLIGHSDLLQAILSSKKVKLREAYNAFFPEQKETIIYYHLSGVTVPGNYWQEFTLDESLRNEVALYDFDYTKAVRQAIEQKYKEQWGYTAE